MDVISDSSQALFVDCAGHIQRLTGWPAEQVVEATTELFADVIAAYVAAGAPCGLTRVGLLCWRERVPRETDPLFG